MKIEFFASEKNSIAQYSSITLTNTLYILGFPLNIVNGYRLYASRGTLIKQKLYSASKKIIGLLNF